MLPAVSRLHNPYRTQPDGRIRLIKLIGVTISLMVSAVGLAACQPAPHPTPQLLTATPLPYTATPAPTALPVHVSVSLDTPGRAAIRVINALSTSAITPSVPLDVYLDGSPLTTRLALDLPSGALGFQAGHFQLRVFTSTDQALKLSQPFDLKADQSVVVVFTGTPDKITATTLINVTDLIPAGQIRLSFAHFQDSSAVVTVSAAGIDGQSSRLTTLNASGTVTTASLQPLTVQSIKLVQSGRESQAIPLNAVDRQAYLAVWLPSGSVALITDNTPRTAQIRVIDANTTSQAVELRLNTSGGTGRYLPLSGAMNFGQNRSWQPVVAGHYTVGLFDAGAAVDTRPKFTVGIDLLADTNQNVMLYGTSDHPQISVISEDLSPFAAGGTDTTAANVRLIIFNAAPGTHGLLTLLSGSIVHDLPPAEYGQSSGPLLTQSGSLSLAFQAQSNNPGKPQAVEYKAPISALANTAYLYVVTGSNTDIPAAVFSTTLPAPVNSSSASTSAITTPTPGIGLHVRLINALGDGTAVDLTLNGKPLFQAVSTGTGTDYKAFDLQSGTWQATIAGQTGRLSSVDLAPISSGSITLLIIGSASSARLEQSVDMLPAGASVSSALFDVIDAATGIDAIRVDNPVRLPTAVPSFTPEAVLTVGPDAITATPINQTPPTVTLTPIPGRAQQLVGHLGYGELSPIISLSPDSYNFAVHDAATNKVLAQLPVTALTIGNRYDLVILPVSGGSGHDFRVVLIDSNVADNGNP